MVAVTRKPATKMRIQYRTPQSRAAAAHRKAEAEREADIPDRTAADVRQAFDLDLRSAGGPHLRIEPRRGYLSWRAVDAETGRHEGCAMLKSLLHQIADQLPRSARHD